MPSWSAASLLVRSNSLGTAEASQVSRLGPGRLTRLSQRSDRQRHHHQTRRARNVSVGQRHRRTGGAIATRLRRQPRSAASMSAIAPDFADEPRRWRALSPTPLTQATPVQLPILWSSGSPAIQPAADGSSKPVAMMRRFGGNEMALASASSTVRPERTERLSGQQAATLRRTGLVLVSLVSADGPLPDQAAPALG